MSLMLEWDDFRVFLAIARHGSLTAAARVLRVTQPTMGRPLDIMEERLGARLFERQPTNHSYGGMSSRGGGRKRLPLAMPAI